MYFNEIRSKITKQANSQQIFILLTIFYYFFEMFYSHEYLARKKGKFGIIWLVNAKKFIYNI